MKKDVMILTGAGQIGMAIARRMQKGKMISFTMKPFRRSDKSMGKLLPRWCFAGCCKEAWYAYRRAQSGSGWKKISRYLILP